MWVFASSVLICYREGGHHQRHQAMLEMQLFNHARRDATLDMFQHGLRSSFYAGCSASQRLALIPRVVGDQDQWPVWANPSWNSSCNPTGEATDWQITHAGSQPMKPSARGPPNSAGQLEGRGGDVMAVSEVFWFKKAQQSPRCDSWVHAQTCHSHWLGALGGLVQDFLFHSSFILAFLASV